MNYPKTKVTIKQWAEEDRPREKLINLGKSNLTNVELLAILIGSGNREKTAVELSQEILSHSNFNLHELGKSSLKELMDFKGIGEAKAITIQAALELGKRRKAQEVIAKKNISSSNDAYLLISPKLSDLQYEEFWIILLNRANKPIETKLIGKGGVSGTVADIKLIFNRALEQLASGIILCHNHPSGNLTPSQADIQLTKKVKEAGKILDIAILDHLIIGDNEYFSFADDGMM